VTVIAFVGSVFSPWYHWAGRREPENHVAINVALYSRRGNRWSMTNAAAPPWRAKNIASASGRVRSPSRTAGW